MSKLRATITRHLDNGTADSVATAKALLTTEASSGNSEAQFLLFEILTEYDQDATVDALDWLTQAAENGSSKAAYYLYRLYANESDFYPVEVLKAVVTANPATSKQWFSASLNLGYLQALWDQAQIDFQSQKYAEALARISAIKALKSKEVEDEPEALQSAKAWCKETETEISRLQKLNSEIEKANSDPESMKPEQLYNLALELWASDRQRSVTYLTIAANKGMAPARKKLAEIAKSNK